MWNTSKTQKFSTQERNCTKINKSITHTPPPPQTEQNSHLHRWTHSQTLLIFLKVLAFSSWHKEKRRCVIEHNDQHNLEKTELVWSYSSRGLDSIMAGRHGSKQRGGRSRKLRDHIYSQSPCPLTYFLQQGCSTLTSPNSATDWIPKVQMSKPVGDIVIKPSQRSSTEGFQRL